MSGTRAKKVVFIGDSTLDSEHWDPDLTASVPEQLKSVLTDRDIVINLAMDGYTTEDVLSGAYKDKAFRQHPEGFTSHDPVDSRHTCEMFYPLKELEKIAKEGEPTHIFLSVGGNDFRESIVKIIFTQPEERINELRRIIKKANDNAKEIIERLKKICPKSNIAIMLQYTPNISPDVYYIYFLMQQIAERKKIDKDSLGTKFDFLVYKIFGQSISIQDAAVKQLHDLMVLAFENVISEARKMNIPVLDMATSFDHTNKDLYVKQIEPSRQGAALIAEMMVHVMAAHDFSGQSAIYVKPGCTTGPIITIKGDQPWRPHSIPKDDPSAAQYFKAEYDRKFKRDCSKFLGIFGLLARSKLTHYDTVEQITHHAQSGGERTLEVMNNMGWGDGSDTNDERSPLVVSII